jgi:serine phosphatase RsbU (regulator of sigma subunit)
LNAVLFESKSALATMTFFGALIDVAAGTMTAANAAHPFPMLVRKTPTGHAPPSRLIIDPGPPLGYGEHPFADTVMPFNVGDLILVYTDGLTENRAADGKLWTRSLAKKIGPEIGRGAAHLRDFVVKDAGAHFGKATRDDDMTVVVFERVSAAARAPEQRPDEGLPEAG